MFSRRVPSDLAPNPLSRAVLELRAAGASFIDLTESNPTRVGIQFPRGLLDALGAPASYSYDPQPLGLQSARRAVASEYARRAVAQDPQFVALTTSTSESYSYLFRLLCDPGSVVLVPRPSYPLFEYLTQLDGIESRNYSLRFDDAWTVDVAEIEAALDERVRAVIVVSPNNPTGTRLDRDTLTRLAAACASAHVALIGDEVFADYHLDSGRAPSVLEQTACLAFSLGGLSKAVGLPQLKLGWIAVGGPSELRDEALARLEVVADAYLSVSTPIQLAAPAVLNEGAAVREQIAARVLLNYRTLTALAREFPACRVPPVCGGWSAVIRAPAVMPDDVRALELLKEEGVLVHPGYLFDFDNDGFFVVSLLPAPADFEQGVRAALGALSRD
jgi:alanine-synthesizing transaminase